jgi:two-component system, OmpR family, alkaline phosphatase synthesis response regulator PhoP
MPRSQRSSPRRRDLRFHHAPHGSPGAGAGKTHQAGTRRRILVVDDEQAMRALCRVNLTASGMDVLEAADGQTALQLAASERPDLVLLDVMLPGLSGWEVASALAALPETRAIPVVFLSARADHADLVRGQEHGAVGYVTKPFDPVQIGDLVERTIQRVARGEQEQLRAEITGEP